MNQVKSNNFSIDYENDIRFHTTNALVNSEDIKDHYGVGGIFTIPEYGESILTLWHRKYSFWTIPIGKVPIGQDPDVGFIREMEEELGIWIPSFKMELMGTFIKKYHRGNNIFTRINTHLYKVNEYQGIIENKEPTKHPKLRYMSLEFIKNLPREQTSDILRFYISLKEILECPTRKF